jgi:hypothetical protein
MDQSRTNPRLVGEALAATSNCSSEQFSALGIGGFLAIHLSKHVIRDRASLNAENFWQML